MTKQCTGCGKDCNTCGRPQMPYPLTHDEMFEQWKNKYNDMVQAEINGPLDDADFEALAHGFFIALGCKMEHLNTMYGRCKDEGVA